MSSQLGLRSFQVTKYFNRFRGLPYQQFHRFQSNSNDNDNQSQQSGNKEHGMLIWVPLRKECQSLCQYIWPIHASHFPGFPKEFLQPAFNSNDKTNLDHAYCAGFFSPKDAIGKIKHPTKLFYFSKLFLFFFFCF